MIASKRKVSLLDDRAFTLRLMQDILNRLKSDTNKERRELYRDTLKRLGQISKELDNTIRTL